jgi:SOS-response transcriptional repressor LexA
MPPRPVKQLLILDALREAHERHGRLPDLSGLARRFGISYPTLREHLAGLEAKGHLHVTPRGRGRSPEVRLAGLASGLPVYGEIVAGLPVGTDPEPEGCLPLPGAAGSFALRVRGDSMAERIEHGDVVLLAPGLPQRSGEICALRVGDDEATLKYLEWQGPRPRRYRLRAHNARYPSLEVAARDVHVDGVFRGLLRGPIVQELLTEGGRSVV